MKSKIINQNIVVCFMVVVLLLFMTIGYASYNESLDMDSSIKLAKDSIEGNIDVLTDHKFTKSIDDDGITFSINISNEAKPNTKVTLINNSEDTLTYTGNNSLCDKEYPIIKGIIPGEYILPHEERTIEIKSFNDERLNDLEIDFNFLYNAIDVIKPVIITNVSNSKIELIKGKGIIDIDILNLYDSSIELEFYFNDSDLGIEIIDNRFILNKEENKKISLNIEGNIEEDVMTTLYAKVLNKNSNDDIYLIENIMFFS